MDTFRRQASKLREQVAKQQQAVLKQFAGLGLSQGLDGVVADEAELQRNQQLERLSISTRAAKHFQRDVIKGVESVISSGVKQMDVAGKLAEDCIKYSSDGPNSSGALARASQHLGAGLQQIEKERDSLHRSMSTQVLEPLRSMVMGAPLEDARHLCQRYDRLRQEAESQALEVGRRQAKAREVGATVENTLRLKQAEEKLGELTAVMSSLGKEAASAMIAVEAQQQRFTLQRLIAMVESEQAYHQRLTEILEQVHRQYGVLFIDPENVTTLKVKCCISDDLERQRSETSQKDTSVPDSVIPPPSYNDMDSDVKDSTVPKTEANVTRKAMHFLAEVLHSFEAESPGELSIKVGDFVVVRQVSPSGWSEGECKGKCGWFPSSHVERRLRAPAGKIVESS